MLMALLADSNPTAGYSLFSQRAQHTISSAQNVSDIEHEMISLVKYPSNACLRTPRP